MSTNTVLVTGATGQIGSLLVGQLARRGVPVRVMVRRAEQGERFGPDVEVVVADLDDPASVATAVRGVRSAFLNTPSSPEAAARQTRFADLASDAGVEDLVVLSQYAADATSPVRFLRWHAEVERHLTHLGVGHTVLRPNLFLQGMLVFAAPIARHGRLTAPIGDAAVSLVDTRDIAEVAAVVLTEPGHRDSTYTLTGPQAITHHDIARALSEATGRSVVFTDVSESAFADALTPLLPAWTIAGLVEDYAHYRRGEAAEIDPAIPQLLGRPARDLGDFARDHADAFTPPAVSTT